MDRAYKNHLDLASIVEVDRYAKALEDTARKAALYYYSAELNKWSSAEIYGPCYLYERHAEPSHSLFLRNSKNVTSLVEPIGPDMQIASQSPFLFYDNGCGLIRSLRFDRASDCCRFSARINMLIKEQNNIEMMAAGDGPHIDQMNMRKGVNDAASRIKTTEILQKLAQSQPGGAFVVGKSANFTGTPNITLTPQLQSRISHIQQEKQQWFAGMPQMVGASFPSNGMDYNCNPTAMVSGIRARVCSSFEPSYMYEPLRPEPVCMLTNETPTDNSEVQQESVNAQVHDVGNDVEMLVPSQNGENSFENFSATDQS